MIRLKTMIKNSLFDTNLEVAVTAIIIVGILEAIALLKGVDGTMFGAAMVALGGIIGWVCKSYHTRKK